jgi:hypothetical protein
MPWKWQHLTVDSHALTQNIFYYISLFDRSRYWLIAFSLSLFLYFYIKFFHPHFLFISLYFHFHFSLSLSLPVQTLPFCKNARDPSHPRRPMWQPNRCQVLGSGLCRARHRFHGSVPGGFGTSTGEGQRVLQ